MRVHFEELVKSNTTDDFGMVAALFKNTQLVEAHRDDAARKDCLRDECLLCGVMDCPDGHIEHYFHDGCPSCYNKLNLHVVNINGTINKYQYEMRHGVRVATHRLDADGVRRELTADDIEYLVHGCDVSAYSYN